MANEIYTLPETPIIWQPGGVKDINLNNLGSGQVSQCGGYVDRGSGAFASEYLCEVFIDGFATAPTPTSGAVFVYWSMATNATLANEDFDGVPSGTPSETAAYAFDADNAAAIIKLGNLLKAVTAIVYVNTAAAQLKVSRRIKLPARWKSPVLYNNGGANLAANNNHYIKLTPVPDQIQP